MHQKRKLKQLLIWVLSLSIFLGACNINTQSAPTSDQTPILKQPTITNQIKNTSVPTQSPPPQLGPCEGNSEQTQINFVIVEPGTKVEHVWKSQFVPWWVRPSYDGRILAVSNGGDSIYELKSDGTLGVAYQCPGAVIETFAAASDGALWFATRFGGQLYRVDKDGSVKILAQNGNRNLEAGTDGSVFALENGLVQIFPNGTSKLITKEFTGRKFTIGQHGEIVALKNGNVLQILENGEIVTIATGYGPEPWLTFGPDGSLYVTHWSGIDKIELESKIVTSISWLKGSNIAESGTFAPDGRLLMYHPNTDVYAIDLENENWSVFYQVNSNSWAMATNPGDGVYIAFGNNLTDGETSIYRVVNELTLEHIFTVPYGIERSMTFDFNGTGYLAVGDEAKGGAIFKFDPENRDFELYHKPQCFPGALTVNPQTNQLWWNDCNKTFETLDENGNLQVISGISGGENYSLAITAEGEFYAITFFHRDNPNIPYKHGLYHYNLSTLSWEEVADLTQMDAGITLSTLVACKDGNIYTVESLDSSNVPVDYSSFNAVRRLETNGTLTLLGFDFGFDGLAADCDKDTGEIYLTSGEGIFSITPP